MNNKGTNSSDTRVRMKTGAAKNATAQGSTGCSTLTGRGSSLLMETYVNEVVVLQIEMRGPFNSLFVYDPMRNQTKVTDNLSTRNQTLLILFSTNYIAGNVHTNLSGIFSSRLF